MKLVNMRDSKSRGATLVGSSPTSGTNENISLDLFQGFFLFEKKWNGGACSEYDGHVIIQAFLYMICIAP